MADILRMDGRALRIHEHEVLHRHFSFEEEP